MKYGRVATVSHVIGTVGRALFDTELRAELALRMADVIEYDKLFTAIERKYSVGAEGLNLNDATTGVGPILVTTNEGLFLLSADGWHCLFPIACFGLARNGADLFLGVSAGLYSFVIRGRLNVGHAQCALGDFRILAKFETRYHNERIHQIAYDSRTDSVLCANTRRTSLVAVNPVKGGIEKEDFLFEDATGFPVYTDQAHLNSVTPHGDAILFAMHNAGDHGSALGFVLNGRVRAYAYPVRGVHDILIHDDALMFTDSFRADRIAVEPDVSGAIRYKGGEYLASQTDSVPRKLVLRGLAWRSAALIVGYSFYAKRERRLIDTAGGVLVLRDGSLEGLVDGPFSQVYDVLPLDGIRTERSGPVRSGEELHDLFERDVGPLIYDRAVPQPGLISKLR